MKNAIAMLATLATVCGCGTISKLPFTHAETTNQFSYVPIDPLPVQRIPDFDCPNVFGYASSETDEATDDVLVKRLAAKGYEFSPLPLAFPDNAVRIAYKSYDASGNVTYGPVGTTASNSRYQIVIDFINSDVSYFDVYFRKGSGDLQRSIVSSETYFSMVDQCVRRSEASATDLSSTNVYDLRQQCVLEIDEFIERKTMPAYIGVGLRVVADIVTMKGGAKLDGLPAIAAAADAGAVNGSMVVQTLGINGQSVTAALPLQSELSASSVQSALIAIGSIKTKMYDEDVSLKPRIVGFYNAIGADEQEANAIAAQLSSNQARVRWESPCRELKLPG